jgi:hypothetical protein
MGCRSAWTDEWIVADPAIRTLARRAAPGNVRRVLVVATRRVRRAGIHVGVAKLVRAVDPIDVVALPGLRAAFAVAFRVEALGVAGLWLTRAFAFPAAVAAAAVIAGSPGLTGTWTLLAVVEAGVARLAGSVTALVGEPVAAVIVSLARLSPVSASDLAGTIAAFIGKRIATIVVAGADLPLLGAAASILTGEAIAAFALVVAGSHGWHAASLLAADHPGELVVGAILALLGTGAALTVNCPRPARGFAARVRVGTTAATACLLAWLLLLTFLLPVFRRGITEGKR